MVRAGVRGALHCARRRSLRLAAHCSRPCPERHPCSRTGSEAPSCAAAAATAPRPPPCAPPAPAGRGAGQQTAVGPCRLGVLLHSPRPLLAVPRSLLPPGSPSALFAACLRQHGKPAVDGGQVAGGVEALGRQHRLRPLLFLHRLVADAPHRLGDEARPLGAKALHQRGVRHLLHLRAAGGRVGGGGRRRQTAAAGWQAARRKAAGSGAAAAGRQQAGGGVPGRRWCSPWLSAPLPACRQRSAASLAAGPVGERGSERECREVGETCGEQGR